MSEKAKPSLYSSKKTQPEGIICTSVPKPTKLLHQISEARRITRSSYGTEKTDVDWTKPYIIFHKKRNLKNLGAEKIREFITFLAAKSHWNNQFLIM